MSETFEEWFDRFWNTHNSKTAGLDKRFVAKGFSVKAWNHQQKKMDELGKELQAEREEVKSLERRVSWLRESVAEWESWALMIEKSYGQALEKLKELERGE